MEALEHWIGVAGITDGPILRRIDKVGRVMMAPKADKHGHAAPIRLTDRSVADIVKRTVVKAALADGFTVEQAEAKADKVAGHSLRAGFATRSLSE